MNQKYCVPGILWWLFKTSYESVCGMILAKGGHYKSVTMEVLEKVLQLKFKILHQFSFDMDDAPVFKDWREDKKGTWVICVRVGQATHGHCMVLKDGKGYDGGWYHETGNFFRNSMRVYQGWQLEQL